MTSFRSLFPSSTLSSAASARVSALTDSWTSTPSSRCRRNPFSSPGYLTSSNSTLTENRWHPYAEGCSTPSLVAPVLARDPFPWLHNRTVVIFGSSVDRNHVNFFCKFAGGRLVTVMPESPLSPRPLEAGWLPEGASVGPASQPRYCRIEEYSFTIVFVFHYGILQDWSDYKLASPVRHFTPPSLAEDRLSSLLLPFLDHLQSANFAGPIDLLEASSIEWDLEAWQFSSAQRKSGAELHLQDAWDTYLPLFALRLPQLAEALIQAFPRHSKTTLGSLGPIYGASPISLSARLQHRS